MSRLSWIAGAALGCSVALTGAAFGFAPPDRPAPPAPPATAPPAPAERATPPATSERTTTQPTTAETLRAKDVMGSKVSLKGGLAIGTVDDIIFDDGGDIDYLVVQNEGKDVLVPWEAAKFDFSARTATVEVTQEQWSAIPTYAPNQLPANVYEPAFQTKIYGYYNMKPPERRERRGR